MLPKQTMDKAITGFLVSFVSLLAAFNLDLGQYGINDGILAAVGSLIGAVLTGFGVYQKANRVKEE